MTTTGLPPDFLSVGFCQAIYLNAFDPSHLLQACSMYEYLFVIDRIKAFLCQSRNFSNAYQSVDQETLQTQIATFVLKDFSLLSPYRRPLSHRKASPYFP